MAPTRDPGKRWAAAEREAWLEAVTNPESLRGWDTPVRLPGATSVAAACKGRRRVEVLQPSLKLRLGQLDACRAEV